jgi:hypothetical protein
MLGETFTRGKSNHVLNNFCILLYAKKFTLKCYPMANKETPKVPTKATKLLKVRIAKYSHTTLNGLHILTKATITTTKT